MVLLLERSEAENPAAFLVCTVKDLHSFDSESAIPTKNIFMAADYDSFLKFMSSLESLHNTEPQAEGGQG